MASSVDPDQTAPIGAVCSGSTLYDSILLFVNNARQLFATDDFSRRHFQMHFFLGALRVKMYSCNKMTFLLRCYTDADEALFRRVSWWFISRTL